MTIEEKVKAYDEAVERAKKELQTCGSTDCDAARQIFRFFPELKKSEDERIRKELIEFIKSRGGFKQEYIAWLEKQANHANFCNKIQIGDKVTRNEDGVLVNLSQLNRVAKKDEKRAEQKLPIEKLPFEMKTIGEGLGFTTQQECDDYNKMVTDLIMSDEDKVEPKFRVGNWIVNNISKDVFLIKSINNGYCTLEDIKGNIISPCLPPCESESHLWTIDDAKKGDVLISKDKEDILIYKSSSILELLLTSYISFSKKEGFCPRQYHAWDSNEFIPATKEQRDLLFKKMKDAGYEWDAEKKELRKVEQEPAWSEEDENTIKVLMNMIRKSEIIDSIIYTDSLKEKLYDWLKLLRPQSKQEWSEEDKKMIDKIRSIIEEYAFSQSAVDVNGDLCDKKFIDIDIWLKSLKERYTWKPNFAQLNALSIVSKGNAPDDIEAIVSLYNDLKKLREE